MQKDYRKKSVAAAWKHHLKAFTSRKLEQMMQDYTDKSVVTSFDHTTGMLYIAEGLDAIATLYSSMFKELSDTSDLAVPVIKIMESTPTMDGSVYLIWKCPSCGIKSGTDTIIFSADNKIIRHNIALSSDTTHAHGSEIAMGSPSCKALPIHTRAHTLNLLHKGRLLHA